MFSNKTTTTLYHNTSMRTQTSEAYTEQVTHAFDTNIEIMLEQKHIWGFFHLLLRKEHIALAKGFSWGLSLRVTCLVQRWPLIQPWNETTEKNPHICDGSHVDWSHMCHLRSALNLTTTNWNMMNMWNQLLQNAEDVCKCRAGCNIHNNHQWIMDNQQRYWSHYIAGLWYFLFLL